MNKRRQAVLEVLLGQAIIEPPSFPVPDEINAAVQHHLYISRQLLRSARRDAKAYNVKVPRNLTAQKSSTGQWWVQGMTEQGEYIEADNEYDARAEYITRLIRRTHSHLDY
jgi:hypothetical protein